MIIRRRKSVYWQQQYNNKQKHHRPSIYVHRDETAMPQNLYFTPRNDIMIRVDFFNECFYFFSRVEGISTIRWFLCLALYTYVSIYSPDIVFVLNNSITTRGVTAFFGVPHRQARKATHMGTVGRRYL